MFRFPSQSFVLKDSEPRSAGVDLIMSVPPQVKLSSLNLDDHARKKMLKLVGERYCKDTDVLTITTDR